jgi:hypothetical protein
MWRIRILLLAIAAAIGASSGISNAVGKLPALNQRIGGLGACTVRI